VSLTFSIRSNGERSNRQVAEKTTTGTTGACRRARRVASEQPLWPVTRVQ